MKNTIAFSLLCCNLAFMPLTAQQMTAFEKVGQGEESVQEFFPGEHRARPVMGAYTDSERMGLFSGGQDLGGSSGWYTDTRWGDLGDGTFANPILNGDYSDPDVIRVGRKYYMTCSEFHFMGMNILESDDMVNWKIIGRIFDRMDLDGYSGMDKYGNGSWAPALRYHDGKFWMYVCTPNEGLFMSTATDPAGPWSPLYQVKNVSGWEDPCPLWDEDGQAYIGRSQLGGGPIIIHKMSADGKTLLDDGRKVYEGPTAEGTKLFLKDGYYYIIYSVRDCCGPQSDYAVSVARSKKLEGPYEKYLGNPILHGSKEVLSIGHGTITTTPDGRMYYLCHAYQPGSGFYQGRQPYLQEVRMGEDHWPHFVTGEYASRTQPMPFAESAQVPVFDFSDDFTGATLRPEWSWNYPYTDVKTEIKNGKLSLSGTPKPGVKTGAALYLRPTSPNYTLETAIVNRNDSWKGITMYGDANNLITCGCAGDRLILKYILEGKEHQLADLPLPASPLYLQMKVTDGTHSTFYWSKDGQAWNEIVGEALSAKETRSLIQWDRISRPGLYQEGDPTALAVYAYCLLKNE
mgnify:CR=1 FL=1